MTAPGRHAAPRRTAGPVVEVRLSGELAACDVLTAILAACPSVAVTGQSGPCRNRCDPGHRLYLTVRLDLTEGNPS